MTICLFDMAFENISCRVISFKQSAESEEYIYFLSGRPLEIGSYYYNRSMGRFACIQHCLEPGQVMLTHPRVEATNNPQYELPAVPAVFVENYFKNGKIQKHAPFRINIKN
jgi:hypothetical protein